MRSGARLPVRVNTGVGPLISMTHTRAVSPKDQAAILGEHDRRLTEVQTDRGLSDHADVAISGGIDRVDGSATGGNGDDSSVGGQPGARVIITATGGHFGDVRPGQRAPARARRKDLGVADAAAANIGAAENEQLAGAQSDEGGIPTSERHRARRIGGQAVRFVVKNVGVWDAHIYYSNRAIIAACDKYLIGRRDDLRSPAELVDKGLDSVTWCAYW